ncbi:UNVERIFIED_CONTAM: hypothetical protein RMT77_012686 [Armadillidium vulgare]
MKIPASKMNLILRPSVQILHKIFTKHKYEIRVVGGAVRDLLMDKIPTDLDFATTATPNEMKNMFTTEDIHIKLTGALHGTVKAYIEEDIFECTTLRIDKSTDGRHAVVEFIRDWELDARRRDLTVNAMFLGIDGTVYDYFNGIQHVKERKVYFIGKPEQRIQEDYLRILRYFRFFGRVAADPHQYDPEIITAIEKNSEGLSKIAGERIWVEFSKILSGRFNYEILLKIIECGVGIHIGLTKEFDCDNLKKVYKNLEDTDYHHCTLLAAGMSSEEDAYAFINRVKCSNKEKEILLFIIKHRKSFNNIQSLKDIQDILVNLVYIDKKKRELVLELSKQALLYVGRSDLLNEVNGHFIPNFPIKGGLLADKIPKNQIQKELKRLFEIWKESEYKLTADELLIKV